MVVLGPSFLVRSQAWTKDQSGLCTPRHRPAKSLKPAGSDADTQHLVSELIWIFERAGERLQIRRDTDDDSLRLTVTQADDSKSYRFEDAASLISFQTDMEAMLVQTGWSFVEFSPEQRRGRDRRGWPRPLADRRRWWTDGTRLPMPTAGAKRRRSS